jgi:hypothetical protein
MKQYTPPAQIKQTLHTQPGVTYVQIMRKPNGEENCYTTIQVCVPPK